jgi:hypothetical protein
MKLKNKKYIDYNMIGLTSPKSKNWSPSGNPSHE